MVCGNFILPEFCKLCLFSFLRNLFYLIICKACSKLPAAEKAEHIDAESPEKYAGQQRQPGAEKVHVGCVRSKDKFFLLRLYGNASTDVYTSSKSKQRSCWRVIQSKI